MNSIEEAIFNRRSVYPKQFSGEAIPPEVLDRCFEAANQAPTHKRTQPWRFVVYADAAKEALIDEWIVLARRALLLKGEEWTETQQKKFDTFRLSSHIVLIACQYSGLVPEVEETCATAIAVQNFWLTLQSLGYHGYWSTGNGIFGPEIHQYARLEENEKALGYFIAGKTNGPLPPSSRKPVSEFVRQAPQ